MAKEIIVLDRPNPHDGYRWTCFEGKMDKFRRITQSSCSLWIGDWQEYGKMVNVENG